MWTAKLESRFTFTVAYFSSVAYLLMYSVTVSHIIWVINLLPSEYLLNFLKILENTVTAPIQVYVLFE